MLIPPPDVDTPPDFLPWRVNQRSPADDVAQIAASDGLRLIADVYGDRCRERAALIVRAVNAYPLLNEAAEVLRYAQVSLRLANQNAIRELEGTGDDSIFQAPLDAVSALLSKLEGQ